MEFFLGVTSSLVASVIFLVFANSRNWIVVGRTRRQWSMARRLDRIGMTNFFASRADYVRYRPPGSIVDYLGNAKSRIDIAAFWMGHGNEAESTPKQIVAMLAGKPALSVRIAMIDPDGEHVASVSDYLGIPLQELKSRLVASLGNLTSARDSAPKSVQDRLSILTYTHMPAASVIMLDYGSGNGARIQLDFKPFRRPRSESFAFELTAPSPLYTTCSEAWITLLDEAKPYVTTPA